MSTARPLRSPSWIVCFAAIIEIDSDDLQEGLIRLAAGQPGGQQVVSARPAVLDLPPVDLCLVHENVEAIHSLSVRVVLVVLICPPSLDRVHLPHDSLMNTVSTDYLLR